MYYIVISAESQFPSLVIVTIEKMNTSFFPFGDEDLVNVVDVDISSQ